MMAKKIGLLVMVVILAGAYFATDSSAAPDWYTCTVDAAGPGWASIYVELTSAPAFTGKWFIIPTENGKEILAVALTAMTNGMQVLIYADPSLSNPPIYTFYILK
jgi:hypothetical protein